LSKNSEEHTPARPVVWARLLLLLPLIGMCWVSTYNSVEPTLAGVPFFYWYQLIWVLLGAGISGFVYVLEN
jgi:hypothetical protein